MYVRSINLHCTCFELVDVGLEQAIKSILLSNPHNSSLVIARRPVDLHGRSKHFIPYVTDPDPDPWTLKSSAWTPRWDGACSEIEFVMSYRCRMQ